MMALFGVHKTSAIVVQAVDTWLHILNLEMALSVCGS
jgi:hypothetical protein